MESALRTRLLAVPGVASLVGSSGVHVGNVPQGSSYPRIRLQRISTDHAHCQEGGAGIATAITQVDCHARTAKRAKQAADAVRTAVQGWKGASGSVDFRSILLDGERDQFEPDQKGGEQGHYTVQVDLQIHFVESIPTY